MGRSGDNCGRYQVVVGRRVFSAEQKRAIVETLDIGVSVAVVWRHNIKPSLLLRWRRQVEVLTRPTKHPSLQDLPVTIATPAAAHTTSTRVGMMGLSWRRRASCAWQPTIGVAALKRSSYTEDGAMIS